MRKKIMAVRIICLSRFPFEDSPVLACRVVASTNTLAQEDIGPIQDQRIM